MSAVWSARADLAEAAIGARHLRRLWGLPGTGLGVVGWPATASERMFVRWHYWWQAHLVDCLADAAARDSTPARRARLARVTRSIRIRNLTGWTNNYYDDMAWLGLALERAGAHPAAVEELSTQMVVGRDYRVGALPWCRGDDFHNAPANGPAAILLARTGRPGAAAKLADWMDRTLRDPDTGLIFDGIRGCGLERNIYTYCQGVVIGAETELARLDGVHGNAPSRHGERAVRLIEAVSDRLCRDGVLVGGRGAGDAGLFDAITIRYLALAARTLPGDSAAVRSARATASDIVLATSTAAWEGRLDIDGQPLFSADLRRRATVPRNASGGGSIDGSVRASQYPERDLSVQLGGWMIMEAAAGLTG